MGEIRFSGMASGLPPNIVEKIMEAERIPVKTMETQKTKEDDKVKLVGELETKINDITKSVVELVGTRGFMNNKLISGDPSIIDGSVDPDQAVTGEWHVQVDQLAHKPGAMSNGFPDKDATQIGVGYIRFFTDQGKKEVYVNGKTNTLEDVAKAINSSGQGLRASVVNDRREKDAPYKLLVTGLATGDDNQVDFPVVYMLDGDQDFYFDLSKDAQNAKVKVDGFEFESADNNLKDVIPGVVLDLKQAAPGREVRISVKEDLEVISGKIKTFVDSYNAVLSFIQNQHKLQKGSDGKERLGPMGGDGLLRTIESNLRGLIINPQYGLESKIKRIGDMGIEFNRNGTLNFNQEKFNKVLQSDPQSVAMFFRGDGFNVGFIPMLKRQISNLAGANFSPISIRKKGLNDKIENINKRIENKERQLQRREESLRNKFANLESKMSQIQSQGAAVGGIQAATMKPAG